MQDQKSNFERHDKFLLYLLVYENRTLTMKFFCVKEFFRMNFDFENGF